MIGFIFALSLLTLTQSGVAPFYIENTNVKTGTNNLFYWLALAGTNQQFTVVFSGSFTANPYLAYGLCRYRAIDFLLQEYYSMEITYQDKSFFNIRVELTGVTNIYRLQIAFIAFNSTGYPYFLNVVNEVPLGYVELLTNFSVAQSDLAVFTEEIDYTNDLLVNYPGLGPTTTSTSFTAPYSNYRIALFLTTFHMTALPTSPVELNFQAKVINQSFYRMNASFGYNGTITYMRFSQVFLNMADYSSTSNKYLLSYESTHLGNAPKFFQFDNWLVKNFMMGLKSFKADSGQCVLEYQWLYAFVNGLTGAQVQISAPVNWTYCGLSQITNTVFLFVTYSCSYPFHLFDMATNLCQSECSPYYYANLTDFTCYPCTNTLCYACQEISPSTCTACATNMVIFNSTCICNTSAAAFLYVNLICFSCLSQKSYCLTCSYSGNTSLAYISSSFTCLTCDETAKYYLEGNECLLCGTNMLIINSKCICNTSAATLLYVNGICFTCGSQKSYCLTCSYSGNTSLAYNSNNFGCLTCNQPARYFLDIDDCVYCTLQNCITCLNLTSCKVCEANYAVSYTGRCSTCPIFGCQTCVNLTACSVCSSGYVRINNLCFSCPITCECGGYTLPRQANGDCSTLCGDGKIILPYEACDDGNTINGDGCSSTCKIEPYSTCANQPSQCYMNAKIQVELVKSQVSYSTCNAITFSFSIGPDLPFLNDQTIDWSSFIRPSNTSFFDKTLSTIFQNGILKISYTYTADLQNKQLSFDAFPQTLVSSGLYLRQTSNTSVSAKIVPSNNVAAIYCNSDVCQNRKKTETYNYAQTGVSYFGLLLSIFSSKIVGLQMFGVLQLSYFSLSTYDFIHPILASILGKKEINGLNIAGNFNKNEEISPRVQANGYTSSNFLANFNLMYLFTFLIATAGMITYGVTYLINKDTLQQQLLDKSDVSERSISQKSQQSRSLFWHKISKYFLKEILLTFLIFNMFNLSYSAGIQILYINQSDSLSIICMLIAIVSVFTMIVAQTKTDKQEFGQYVQKFKKQKYESKYMLVTILYRFTLGFLMAILNEFILCSLVLIFVSAAFLTYICYFEPFNHPFQNIRSKVVHSIHILILFVAFYYRMQGNYDQIQAAYLSLPAYLMLLSVGITAIGSTCLLMYEILVRIKEKCFKRQNLDSGQQKVVSDKVEVKQMNIQQTMGEIQQPS